jgi:hypothetical protein
MTSAQRYVSTAAIRRAVSGRGRAYAPVPALCRALVVAGHDPHRPLHVYRGHVLALVVGSIGDGARLRVAIHGIGFEHVTGCTGGSPARQNGFEVVRPGSDATPINAAILLKETSLQNTTRRR